MGWDLCELVFLFASFLFRAGAAKYAMKTKFMHFT